MSNKLINKNSFNVQNKTDHRKVLIQRKQIFIGMSIAAGAILMAWAFFSFSNQKDANSKGNTSSETIKEFDQMSTNTEIETELIAEAENTSENRKIDQVKPVEKDIDQLATTLNSISSMKATQTPPTKARKSSLSWGEVNSSLQANSALIKWTTQSEQFTQSFLIERSVNRKNFEKIGQINAIGMSSQSKNYSFEDKELSELHMPVAYYRIKHQGLDGEITSEVITHKLNLNLGVYIKIIPTPIYQKTLAIQYAADKTSTLTLKVVDSSGEELMSENSLPASIHPEIYNLPIKKLPRGTYYLHLQGSGNTIIDSFIIH